jgi:hypothetical protein
MLFFVQHSYRVIGIDRGGHGRSSQVMSAVPPIMVKSPNNPEGLPIVARHGKGRVAKAVFDHPDIPLDTNGSENAAAQAVASTCDYRSRAEGWIIARSGFEEGFVGRRAIADRDNVNAKLKRVTGQPGRILQNNSGLTQGPCPDPGLVASSRRWVMINIDAPTMPAAASVRLATPMQTQRRFAGSWRRDRLMPVASHRTRSVAWPVRRTRQHE